MKLTVLCDNNSRIDAYYLAEPGVSYLLECDGKRVLFDTGYSDVYLRNAQALGINLTDIDAIAISHGHIDHTGGLPYFPHTAQKVPLYGCPGIFTPKRDEDGDNGAPITYEEAARRFDLRLNSQPTAITEHLWHLGQIPRVTDFECKRPFGECWEQGIWQPDMMLDDSALVYQGNDGLTIITACSHSGICNIVEHAKRLFHEERIAGIIGGFHMLKMTSRVEKTVAYLEKQHIAKLCPCHCTNFYARAAIHKVIPIEDICVADISEFE